MGLYNRFCKRFFAAVIVRTTAQADSRALMLYGYTILRATIVVVVVVFTLKAVPISTQYFITSVLVQLTRTSSVVTG